MVTKARPQINVQERFVTSQAPHRRQLLPLLVFLAMLCATLFLYAVLPLRGLNFSLAFPNTTFGSWLLWPTHLLFPGKSVVFAVHYSYLQPASHTLAWQETALFLAGLVAIFSLYLLALRLLPQRITQRYILFSTLILGLLCVLFPALPSQDIFTYIEYARMGVIYHLNPLVTPPTTIAKDAVYPYVFWVHQPSVYGPVWLLISYALQGLAMVDGLKSILTMTLLLRLFGLVTHLASVQVVWMLCGSLQRMAGNISPRTRLLATLAFAWNPLLLLEACVSAHNDTPMLLLILLALWFLLPREENKAQSYIIAMVLLALATCIKVTVIVFFPLLLFYLWKQQSRNGEMYSSLRQIRTVAIALVIYAGVIILLYAPFWQHGAAMHVIRVNPGTERDINSPYEFLVHLYESIRHRYFIGISPDTGTHIEKFTHTVGFLLFSLLYGLYCLRLLLVRGELTSLPSLIRAIALAWLVYCFIGSPWLWPWYFITFFGLFALIEAIDTSWHSFHSLTGIIRLPLAVRLLAFAALGLYFFDVWIPIVTYVPLLYAMHLTFLRGLWLCIVPLLAIRIPLSAWRTYSNVIWTNVVEKGVGKGGMMGRGGMNYTRTWVRFSNVRGRGRVE